MQQTGLRSREEMSVELIRERIRENLAGAKELKARLEELKRNAPEGWDGGPLPLPLSRTPGTEAARSLKERFISFGLRHKGLVEKLPLAKPVLKRLYRSLQSSGS